MDILTFVSKMAESTAWPLAVLSVVLLLRPNLKQVLMYMRKLKYKDLEMDFGEGVKDARSEAEAAGLPPPTDKKPLRDDGNWMLMATQFPEAAILESFKRVEAVLAEMAEKHFGASLSSFKILDVLRGQGKVDAHTYEMYQRLRRLRNVAVHDRVKVTPGEVLEYRDLAERLADKLQVEFLTNLPNE